MKPPRHCIPAPWKLLAILAFVAGSLTLFPAANAQNGAQDTRLPPPVLLGARAEVVRTQLKVRPTVVIVRTPDEFAMLIAAWSLHERFPILIDDGTDRAREDIARFVRAFEPATVVRWSAPSAEGGAPAAALPAEPRTRAAAIDSAWRAAWGARTPDELRDIWKQTEFHYPGVVVASPSDPAWTAALALAAGRGQPILWVESERMSPSAALNDQKLAALDSAIQNGIEQLKPAQGWKALGDQVDAITLCLNTGARLIAQPDELALTDRIGRFADGSRYAWAGMIFGEEARAAYTAMCALFLQPRGAWLIDGYKPDFAPPFHLDRAIEIFDKAGYRLSTNLPPHGTIENWRERTRFGLSADFVHVNTSGLNTFFDLNPGRGYPSDIPPLNRPAIVHFVHSFSAQQIGNRDTIGGRWIENGAYAYLGSVHEPYLGAFQPGHMLAVRLLSKAPWGAAVRLDGGKLWKLNVFGDPLLTLGDPAPRHEEPLTLKGASSVEDEMRAALKERDLARGVGALIMLGQDATAAKLAKAALDPTSGAMTPELARIALPAAFRERDPDLFLALYGRMTARDKRDTLLADMLWRVARPMISSADASLVAMLRETIRPLSIADDAQALAPAINRLEGREATKLFFADLMTKTSDAKARQALMESANAY